MFICIKIAGISLSINTDFKFHVEDQFSLFIEEKDTDYEVECSESDKLTSLAYALVYENLGYKVYKNLNNDFIKQYHCESFSKEIYAESRVDWSNKKVVVKYLKTGLNNLQGTNGIFFHINWEEILLHERRLLLHACAVNTVYGAILFSGPSGIGKSTQGNLWLECESAVPINGDRPIVYKQDNKWITCGSPYAGSSEWHFNISAPVCCIVMLAQSEVCSIKKLTVMEAFQKVFPQITAKSYDSDSLNKACDLVMELIADVPVYELKCTPTRDAVDLLKQMLDGGEKIGN